MWGRSGSSFGSLWQLNGALMNPSQAGHSQAPDTISPLWPAALTLERNPLGDSPHHPKQQHAHPKVHFAQHCYGGPFFFCPAQVLSSRHSDGPYCTARQKKRQPSLWAADRPCLDWKDFDGAKQGGGSCTEKLVSPGQPLWLSVPAQSSPSHPTYYPFPFFFFPSLVVHKAPSWVKGTGFCMKVSVWHSRVLFSWLTSKNGRSKKHLHRNPPLWAFSAIFPLQTLLSSMPTSADGTTPRFC